MHLFRKNKSDKSSKIESSPNPRTLRYWFDYEIMPSYYTHCIEGAFYPEMKKDGSFGRDSFAFFNNKGYEEFENASTYEVFGIAEGQISICRFPESEFSPSVLYAISFLRMEDYLKSVNEKTSYYPPYYILTKMPCGYITGRIFYEEESERYYSEYYEQMETPELLSFLKWVVEREDISIKPAGKGDPISSFLSGCE